VIASRSKGGDVKTRILAAATAVLAPGLLAGCYVIPMDPRYTPSEQAAVIAGKGVPAAVPQGGPASLQARLYPLNEIAGGMGPLSVTLTDNASGHASFALTYGGEVLQGEATRVGPNYPGFGKVHREVYGDGRMPAALQWDGQRQGDRAGRERPTESPIGPCHSIFHKDPLQSPAEQHILYRCWSGDSHLSSTH
jgi:hypothetical protein